MEDIYVDAVLDKEMVSLSLARLFPDLKIFYWDLNDDSPNGYDSENDKHIFFNININNNKKEFGLIISIYRTPDKDAEERALFIGREISNESNVRVLVPFINPEFPDVPFYDIMFYNEDIGVI